MNQVPKEIEWLIEDYKALLIEEYNEPLFGIYLFGSIAMGEFDFKKSDIDFITVFKRQLTNTEVDALKQIHKLLEKSHAHATRLDGMYLTVADLGKSNAEIHPYPFYAEGDFKPSGYYNVNEVTWATLKTVVYGPVLHLESNWNGVLEAMDYNLNIYWKQYLDMENYTDEDIEWIVLSLCRILYTIERGGFTSKLKAGQYGLGTLNTDYHKIIEEAIRLYRGEPSIYQNGDDRYQDLKAFLDEAIRRGNLSLSDAAPIKKVNIEGSK